MVVYYSVTVKTLLYLKENRDILWNSISMSVGAFPVSFAHSMSKKDNQNLSSNAEISQHYLHIHTVFFFPTASYKKTHILPRSHMSKQTFKSLQKYKILFICISFFYLHFEMAEIIPNWHESPMSHLSAALHFREPFKPAALSSLPMNAACH